GTDPVCRLTAYLGEPVAASTLVFGGSHPLFRQSWAPRELLSGSVNADGYGVVWYAEAPRVTGGNERSASPAAAAGDADRNARSDRSLRPARIAETRPIWRDEEELRATLGLIGSSCV